MRSKFAPGELLMKYIHVFHPFGAACALKFSSWEFHPAVFIKLLPQGMGSIPNQCAASSAYGAGLIDGLCPNTISAISLAEAAPSTMPFR